METLDGTEPNGKKSIKMKKNILEKNYKNMKQNLKAIAMTRTNIMNHLTHTYIQRPFPSVHIHVNLYSIGVLSGK
jgi:hypothetical protein